jgi:hypothetical protein
MTESWKAQKRRTDWEELSFLYRETIIDELSNKFSDNLDWCYEINKRIESDEDWWVELQDWAIEVKTFLRTIFSDYQLPKESWDYYWVAAIEKSVERVLENESR